jgi:restriction endonuclease S subunit
VRVFQAKLSDAASAFALRCDSPYLAYMKEDFPKVFPKGKFRKFSEVIKSIHNGEDLPKDAYSFEPTRYLYLSVAAITRTGIAFNKTVHLDGTTGEAMREHWLADKQVIMGRSGTHVGRSCIFNAKEANGKKVIPSGYTMVIDLDLALANPRFVVAYLNTPAVQKYLVVCSTEKIQRNLAQHYVGNLPFPHSTKDEQDEIAERIVALDEKRKKLASELTNLDVQERELAWKAY